MELNKPGTEELLRQAGNGDGGAIGWLFERHRDQLHRVVASRLDRRVAARLDPSDVVQDALSEASEKLAGFLRDRPVPFFFWLRWLTLLHLRRSHRYHLRTRKRSAARDVGLEARASANSSSSAIDRVLDTGTSPSEGAVRDEECERVRVILTRLEDPDRTILALRYVEQLSLAEIADRLGIGLGAVKMRHLRALKRFRTLLDDTAEEPAP